MSDATQAPPAAEAAPPAPPIAEQLRGLGLGRIVICKDELGVERAGIVTRVIDRAQGTINLVEFAALEGEEAAVQRCNYTFTTERRGARVWWWPPKS